MKFNQNSAFNAKVKFDGDVDRDDAILHLVNRIRQFLTANAKDGTVVYLNGNVHDLDEDGPQAIANW